MYVTLKVTVKHFYVTYSLKTLWEPSFQDIRLEISMAVRAKIMVVWDVTSCSLLGGRTCFRETCYLSFQGPDNEGNRFLRDSGVYQNTCCYVQEGCNLNNYGWFVSCLTKIYLLLWLFNVQCSTLFRCSVLWHFSGDIFVHV
jgi:hypothetical protein